MDVRDVGDLGACSSGLDALGLAERLTDVLEDLGAVLVRVDVATVGVARVLVGNECRMRPRRGECIGNKIERDADVLEPEVDRVVFPEGGGVEGRVAAVIVQYLHA